MTDGLDHIDAMQIDIFREIGSIGGGNAATSLANILDKQINMSIPQINIVPFNDIVNILNGPESLVVGLLVNMSGDLTGSILLILELEDAYEMASLVLGEDRPLPTDLSAKDLGELDRSALSEIANILVGSYLSAICKMTNLNVVPSVPDLAIDMVGAISSIVAIEYGKIGDSVLFLKTQFSDVSKSMDGHFFLIPDFNSYKILLKSLGMDV